MAFIFCIRLVQSALMKRSCCEGAVAAPGFFDCRGTVWASEFLLGHLFIGCLSRILFPLRPFRLTWAQPIGPTFSSRGTGLVCPRPRAATVEDTLSSIIAHVLHGCWISFRLDMQMRQKRLPNKLYVSNSYLYMLHLFQAQSLFIPR